MADPASPVESRGAPSGHEADGRQRFLFESSPLPLWVYDLETLRFLDVNEVACVKYGYTREEFLAMTILDIRPREDASAVRESVRTTPSAVFNSGTWRHRLKNGTLIQVEITSHELLFEGRATRFVCPIDVTARIRMEAALLEREAALRRAQGLAGLGHAVSRADGTFESWSDSLHVLLGVSPDEVPRSTRAWLQLVHPQDRAMFRDRSIEAATVGVRVDVEYRLLRPDGGLMDMRQVIEPMVDADGQRRGRWFSTVQDVTAQKTAESLVRRANEELEARVRERTLQLEASMRDLALATAAAERANRAKSEFLSNMSHELRTPLNAIIGFGQLLGMPEVMDRDGEQRGVFVDHIVDAGRHLLGLINEILNLSQIEAGKLEVHLERVPLDELLAECRAMVATLAGPGSVDLRFPAVAGLALRADRMRLKQVLLNLLSNAIKYNREGGVVAVACTAAGGLVRIEVRDSGIGLSAEQIAGLFQPFNRLGREGGSTEGSGIGLVVTKRLVELMGGRLGVASKVGSGSVFFVELPEAGGTVALPAAVAIDLDGSDAVHAGALAPAQAGRHGAEAVPGARRILCVDDDPACLHLVRQVLGALPGVEVVCAVNGRQAVEIALAEPPALIVIDNNMPEMSGRDAQALLHADPRTAGIPVIALSANAMPGAADAGLAAGFFRYLTKPFDVAALLVAAREALAR